MKNVPAPDRRDYVKTEDGYKVISDYGKLGGGTDVVHIPPKDPETVARNRKVLNDLLARHGYQLANKTVRREGEAG